MKKQFLLMMMALLPMVASADKSGNCGYRLYNDPDNPGRYGVWHLCALVN